MKEHLKRALEHSLASSASKQIPISKAPVFSGKPLSSDLSKHLQVLSSTRPSESLRMPITASSKASLNPRAVFDARKIVGNPRVASIQQKMPKAVSRINRGNDNLPPPAAAMAVTKKSHYTLEDLNYAYEIGLRGY